MSSFKVFSFSLIFTVFVFSSQSSAQDKLLVVGEEFAPFEFVRDGEVVGIDIDIAKEIFKRLEIPVEFRLFIWERAWYFVKIGRADAVLTTSRKEIRKPFVWYPEEDMWVSSFVFFVNADEKKDTVISYEDARDLRVGIIRGNSYNKGFWDAELNTEAARDLDTNLKKLAANRVDLVPADKTVGLYTAKLLGVQDKIDYYEFELFSKGYPMPFVKNSDYPNIEQIARDYEAELKKMKQDGTYDEIFKKWLGRAP